MRASAKQDKKICENLKAKGKWIHYLCELCRNRKNCGDYKHPKEIKI